MFCRVLWLWREVVIHSRRHALQLLSNRIKRPKMIKSPKKYDLAVAYRVYPKISKEPFFQFKDKLELVELSLHSFQESTKKMHAKIWVLLDNCPHEYIDLFEKYFPKEDLEFIILAGEGNRRTFRRQIEILCAQGVSDIVYFAEDDYLYLPGQFSLLTDFVKENPNSFVTPYDHLDNYYYDFYQSGNSIKLFNNHHFRTTYSTCLTFMTSRQTLLMTRKIFESYSDGNHDASLWFSITKPPFIFPFWNLRNIFNNRFILPLAAKAWWYCLYQIVAGKKRQLWVPIPSIATHLDKPFVAPAVDWTKIKDGLKA